MNERGGEEGKKAEGMPKSTDDSYLFLLQKLEQKDASWGELKVKFNYMTRSSNFTWILSLVFFFTSERGAQDSCVSETFCRDCWEISFSCSQSPGDKS